MKSKSASNTMKTQLRITRPNNNNHNAAGLNHRPETSDHFLQAASDLA